MSRVVFTGYKSLFYVKDTIWIIKAYQQLEMLHTIYEDD